MMSRKPPSLAKQEWDKRLHYSSPGNAFPRFLASKAMERFVERAHFEKRSKNPLNFSGLAVARKQLCTALTLRC